MSDYDLDFEPDWGRLPDIPQPASSGGFEPEFQTDWGTISGGSGGYSIPDHASGGHARVSTPVSDGVSVFGEIGAGGVIHPHTNDLDTPVVGGAIGFEFEF